MENLKTFEAAAASQKIDPAILPVVTGLPEAIGKAIVAAYKMMVISQATWNGTAINWDDYSQRKYTPYFNMEPGGFSYDYYVCIARVRALAPASATLHTK